MRGVTRTQSRSASKVSVDYRLRPFSSFELGLSLPVLPPPRARQGTDSSLLLPKEHVRKRVRSGLLLVALGTGCSLWRSARKALT